jgi:hypothetical protein
VVPVSHYGSRAVFKWSVSALLSGDLRGWPSKMLLMLCCCAVCTDNSVCALRHTVLEQNSSTFVWDVVPYILVEIVGSLGWPFCPPYIQSQIWWQ